MRKCPATQLSMEYMRGRGMIVDKVEYNIPSKPFPKHHDLFNLFDLECLDERGRIFYAQTTSAPNSSTRRKKIEASADLVKLILTGGTGRYIEVHGWKKVRGAYEVIVHRAEWVFDHVVFSVVHDAPPMSAIRARMRGLKNGEKIPASARREKSDGTERVDGVVATRTPSSVTSTILGA